MITAQRLLESLHEVNLGVSDKSILIYDGGLYTSIAERLAKDFNETFYHTPYYTDNPKIVRSYIGEGLNNIKVVTDFFNKINDVDAIFFPDCYNEDLVIKLLEDGYPVLGSGKSAFLELNKEESQKVCEQAGIKIPKSEKIIGISNLIKSLKSKKNKYVKPVSWRGSVETFKYTDYESSKSLFDKISLDLGPWAERFEFLVCDEISDSIEGGTENIFFNGEYLSPLILSFTDGYKSVESVLEYENIPEGFRSILDKLKPILEKYKFKGFFSTEIFYDGKESYLSDLTMRASNINVFSGLLELYSNFSDIVYGLATNNLVDPIVSKRYCSSAVLVVSNNITEWATVEASDDSDEWLKLENHSKENGKIYLSPLNQNTVGCISLTGESLEECIKGLPEKFEQVDCSVAFDPIPSESEFNDLVEKIKSYGLEF